MLNSPNQHLSFFDVSLVWFVELLSQLVKIIKDDSIEIMHLKV